VRASGLPSLLALVLLVGGAVLLYSRLGPRLPASTPVSVRGGSAEQPLERAIAGFRPEEIVAVLPRDAIRAIDDPALTTAAKAELADGEQVIGVEIDGRARAYPVGVLSTHEIVNDTIRGRPFAVTW